jgi:hypothetical protein
MASRLRAVVTVWIWVLILAASFLCRGSIGLQDGKVIGVSTSQIFNMGYFRLVPDRTNVSQGLRPTPF